MRLVLPHICLSRDDAAPSRRALVAGGVEPCEQRIIGLTARTRSRTDVPVREALDEEKRLRHIYGLKLLFSQDQKVREESRVFHSVPAESDRRADHALQGDGEHGL